MGEDASCSVEEKTVHLHLSLYVCTKCRTSQLISIHCIGLFVCTDEGTSGMKISCELWLIVDNL